jgi:hypothetical protein
MIVDARFLDSSRIYAYRVSEDAQLGDLIETPANDYAPAAVAEIVNLHSTYGGPVRAARLLGPPPSSTFRPNCEHSIRWQRDYRDMAGSPYRYRKVRFEMTCGCEVDDLRSFAIWAYSALGWSVGTSRGWGGAGAKSYCLVDPQSLRSGEGEHPSAEEVAS